MLRVAKGRAAQSEARRIDSLGDRNPPRSGRDAREREENRVGRKIRPGENESAGGLDLGKRVGIRSRAQRALQSAARTELSEHRLHLLHAPGAAGRRPARGALVGLREERVWAARAGVGIGVWIKDEFIP